MLISKRSLLGFGLASMAAMATAGSGPHGYPAKPVAIVVPFAPGGGSDNIARYIASRLTERTGTNFIIDNRAGAGTNIGNEFVARAPADGYTLLFGQVTLAINPYVYKGLRYDVHKSFAPVAHIADSPTVLLVNPKLPVRDLKQFVAYAKANPGKLNFGSGGTGTSVHLAGELFAAQTQTDMVHVPYKGSAPATADLIGGQIQSMFDTAASALGNVKGGRVQALAVTGPKRLSELPGVPTFAESGMSQFDAPAWYGLLAPAGTAPAIVSYLNEEVEKILKEPQTLQRLAQLGSTPIGGSPEAFGKFIQAEGQRWSSVVASAKVSAE
ncbi:MAG: tripartite tricarboxylate transporter substrate binding protein [Ottowia sp.]|uniref:Bug family tripartite tricarboxylate transporter substrate binding protein n=1 Tax=Ottowia sp. TaxID=1898956 RepID=UPI003C759857